MADISQQLAQGIDPFAGFLRTQAGQQRQQQLGQAQQRIGQEGQRLDLLRQQEDRQAKQQRVNNIMKVFNSADDIDPTGASFDNLLPQVLEASELQGLVDVDSAKQNRKAFRTDVNDLVSIATSSDFDTNVEKQKQFSDKFSAFGEKFGNERGQQVVKQIKEAQAVLPEKAKKDAGTGATKTINAIHQAQTGIPFDEGTQETQQAALDEQQSREVEKARQTGAVAEEFRLRKGLSGESAGKLALLTQASKDVSEVKDFLFDEEGNLNIASQAAGFFNLPVAQGRQINSRIQNAVAAKLRAETGAAANADEVRNIAKRFEPVPGLDNAEATKDKLDRLEEFLSTGAFFIDPTGKLRQRSLQELGGGDLSNLSDEDILKELNK